MHTATALQSLAAIDKHVADSIHRTLYRPDWFA